MTPKTQPPPEPQPLTVTIRITQLGEDQIYTTLSIPDTVDLSKPNEYPLAVKVARVLQANMEIMFEDVVVVQNPPKGGVQ